MATLNIPRCDRSNAGKYTVKATNPYGEDTVELNVVVLDAPGPPEGPLEVTDVLANQATLSWKPPLDECGAPVSEYVVEMQDPDTREATGCFITRNNFIRVHKQDLDGVVNI